MNRYILLAFLVQAVVSAPSKDVPELHPTLRALFDGPDPPKTLILTIRDHPQLGSHANVLDNLEKSTTFLNREHRLNSVVNALKKYTSETQGELLAFLNAKKTGSVQQCPTLKIQPLWITNKIIVKGADAVLFNELAHRPDIARIDPDQIIPLFDEHEKTVKFSNLTIQSYGQNRNQWGVEKVQAPKMWNEGITGKGIVVAVIDTGVRSTHLALRDNFREEYGWLDAIEGETSPVDGHGHGTHCAGSIAGTYGIGVAKEATIIACRCGGGEGMPESALIQCGEWVACPTDPSGENPDCSKAPHIVSNSWGSNGGGATYYDDIIKTWRTQGIIPTFAVGNEGRKGCRTVGSPGDNPDIIGVGSTDKNDAISDFSSVGPNKRGGFKPDLSGPGSKIISAYAGSDDGLVEMSGTSMATPHVSGVIALMLSKDNNLTFDDVKKALIKGCDPVKSSSRNCGGVNERKYPNHVSGYGRTNAVKSMN